MRRPSWKLKTSNVRIKDKPRPVKLQVLFGNQQVLHVQLAEFQRTDGHNPVEENKH